MRAVRSSASRRCRRHRGLRVHNTTARRGYGHALDFERPMCHLVRAARDRAGNVVADIPTPLGEIGYLPAHMSARLLVFLRSVWGEPHREAGDDTRFRGDA